MRTSWAKRVLTIVATVLFAGLTSTGLAHANAGNMYNWANPGLCLGIQGSNPQSGAKAIIGNCAVTDTQTWFVYRTEFVGGFLGYQLRNNDGMCLGVQGGSSASGARVVHGICGSTSDHSQIWRPRLWNDESNVWVDFVSEPGNGWYWLRNGHSGLCLGVAGSNPTSGAAVVQGHCAHTSATQQWLMPLT